MFFSINSSIAAWQEITKDQSEMIKQEWCANNKERISNNTVNK